MSRKPNFGTIQGDFTHAYAREFAALEDIIQDECGVVCTVKVKPECISIRTRSVADFYLAKAAIKNKVGSKAIVKDLVELGEAPSVSNGNEVL